MILSLHMCDEVLIKLFSISVYPTLDLSDNEDDHVFKPRGRQKKDETWNPKGRLKKVDPSQRYRYFNFINVYDRLDPLYL